MKALCLPVIFAFLCLISSCYDTRPLYTIYTPNTINTPLIKKAGDFNATGAAGFVGGLHAQGSFCPINHIVLFGNLMKIGRSGDTNDYPFIRNYEYGAGAFYNIDTVNDDIHQLSIMSGYGKGVGRDSYTFYDGNPSSSYSIEYHQNLRSDYYKYFIQPSCNVFRPHSTTSLSIKLTSSTVSVYAGTIDHSGYGPGYYKIILNGYSRHILNSFEFAFTHQHHYQYLTTFFQYKIFIPNSYVYPMLVTSDSQFAQTAFAFTLGISINSENIKNIFTSHVRSERHTYF